MSYTLAVARKLAMNLGSQDRFALAHELFDSLEPVNDGIDIEEIDRRLAEMRTGTAETVSLDELEKSMQEALDASIARHP